MFFFFWVGFNVFVSCVQQSLLHMCFLWTSLASERDLYINDAPSPTFCLKWNQLSGSILWCVLKARISLISVRLFWSVCFSGQMYQQYQAPGGYPPQQPAAPQQQYGMQYPGKVPHLCTDIITQYKEHFSLGACSFSSIWVLCWNASRWLFWTSKQSWCITVVCNLFF